MKILLVDSDPATIQALLPLLKNTPGTEVRAANNGDKALETAMEGGGADLLITGVFMEPMNGITLRNKLENRFPGVKTVFLSEYDMTDYAEHVSGYEVVAKPVQPNQVLVAIAKTMAPPAAPEVAPAPAPEPEPPQITHAPDVSSAPTQTQAPVAAPTVIAPAPRAIPFVPKATPQVVAQPKVTAVSPQTTPVARPAVAAVPKPATPTASAVPAIPKIAPPTAVPKPAAKPVATPRAATVSAKPAVVAKPVVAVKAAPDPLVGKTLGNYKIVRKLGDGKWGTVYEAEQTSMGR